VKNPLYSNWNGFLEDCFPSNCISPAFIPKPACLWLPATTPPSYLSTDRYTIFCILLGWMNLMNELGSEYSCDAIRTGQAEIFWWQQYSCCTTRELCFHYNLYAPVKTPVMCSRCRTNLKDHPICLTSLWLHHHWQVEEPCPLYVISLQWFASWGICLVLKNEIDYYVHGHF